MKIEGIRNSESRKRSEGEALRLPQIEEVKVETRPNTLMVLRHFAKWHMAFEERRGR